MGVVFVVVGINVNGQVNIIPTRTDVSGFSTWTDVTVDGTTYIQLLVAGANTITPAMDFNSYTSETLNFKARTYGGADAIENEITVSISTDNGSTWIILGTRTPTTTTLTSVTQFDLSAYSGTQVKIKFSVAGTSNTIGAGIDDIEIKGVLICTPPSDPTGTITPTANPACGSTTLSYSGASADIYWQTSATGTSTANPTISAYTVTSSGTYYVRALDGTCWSTGALASSAITINTAPAITTQPINQSVSEPSTATFSVIASNATGYQWQINTGSGWSDISGATLNSYTTAATTTAMSGYQYQCIVSGAAPCGAVTSNAVTLTVNPPSSACLSESFTAGATPAGWLATSISYTESPGTASFNATTGELVTVIVSNPFSLSFDLSRTTNTTVKSLFVEVSTTTQGGAYTTIATYDHLNTTSGGTTACTVDLSSYVSDPVVFIKFRKASATTSPWRLDNIEVNCNSTLPTIILSPTTLTGFSYIEGAGPSAQQSFSCSGANLTNDITLTAPTNYEISTTSGAGFGTTITLTQSGGAVAATTIYVRLIASLPAGNYNLETINATSTGATAKTVTLSGNVIGPIITITPTTISGIEYDFGSGPSAAESFSVSGAGLTANILLTAPSNYEIATVAGGPYGGTLTLTQSGGVVNSTTIYVRLKAGLSVGNYNQSVSATSTGAASKTVYLTGSVKSTPCLLEGFNNGTTAPASWIFTSIGGTYTTSTNYGVASPSLQLDATNDAITTPVIGGATELSFWIKGQGTDAMSALLVEGFNGSWVTIENIVPLPTSGTVKTYNSASTPALASGFTLLRFTYNRSAGNLSFDDVTVICTAVPNTVTSGTVSNAPFSVSCATGSAGSVVFTSTDIFSSNTYTAQLSNAAGSFASPVNIGSLVSDANSGTINVTIPPGTPTGAGYSIRVISSNPVVIGTSSAAFSVTLTDGPCSCYEIESILVDACDEGVEGENEMFRFSVGAGNLSTGDILIDWPNNPWLGICQNAASDSIVAGINATLTPPGQIVQPVGGVIPAGATVMFFTSTAFDFSKFDFSSLNYTLYAVFQCEGNTAGHFGNHTATGEKTLVFDCGACSSESVTYDTDSLYTGDGATVDFDVPGTPTYSDSGYCESVPVFDILPIDLMYFKTVCNNDELYFAWSTATETNNAYFTIEAADAANGDFVPVAKVDGAGNSNEMLEYSINVETKAKYFRLKQTDYDGKFTYSDVIAVDCEDNQVQLFPSLAAEGENITIIGEVSSIRVFDSMGREVFPEINENKVCCLEPGMYFFVINGKWNHKVVVQ